MGLPFFIGISVLVQAIVEEKHLRNLTRGIKKQKAVTPDYLFANLKIKYYEKITMQICGVFLN